MGSATTHRMPNWRARSRHGENDASLTFATLGSRRRIALPIGPPPSGRSSHRMSMPEIYGCASPADPTNETRPSGSPRQTKTRAYLRVRAMTEQHSLIRSLCSRSLVRRRENDSRASVRRRSSSTRGARRSIRAYVPSQVMTATCSSSISMLTAPDGSRSFVGPRGFNRTWRIDRSMRSPWRDVSRRIKVPAASTPI
jgi:hypothetical protein